jgi:ferric-dicitrate binding protein FerR (iron transport regulator)
VRDELKTLARAYGDGTITTPELLQLEAWLEKDPDARGAFLHEMSLIDALEDMAASDSLIARDQGYSPTQPASRWSWVRWVSLAVGAVAVLVFSRFAWLDSSSPTIGTLVTRQGTVRWTGHNGVVETDLEPGDALPGGTLEAVGADAWASFRFHDGSLVTLSGDAEAVLADRTQKQLHLRRGTMSADVEPQPANAPMIVHTSAAELEVLGTQFNVSARHTDTELAVHHGRVRLQRLSDGKTLEVSAKRRVVASIDSVEDLTAEHLGPLPTDWESRFESDANVHHGSWKPPLFSLAARLKQDVAKGTLTEAEALSEYQQAARFEAQGSVWALPSKIGNLVWLDVKDDTGRRVLLSDQSQLRVRGRHLAATTLTMGVSVFAENGGFIGKFIRDISVEKVEQSADGSFEWVVHGRELMPPPDAAIRRCQIHDWWCVADSPTAKFEITHVEVLNPEEETL